MGDIAGEKLADPEHPLLPWLGATLLWFGLLILMDLLVIKSRTLGKLIEGDPTILIENGRIQQKNLFSNFLRVDDLMAALRQKGFFNPADVEFAIFETDGTISVLPTSQARPIQPRDLQIATQYEGITQELIVDRRVIRANLKQTGLSEEWLAAELAIRGYQGPEEIGQALCG